MSDPTLDCLCILFALNREALFFRRRIRPWRPIPGAPGRAWLAAQADRSLLVMETGIGAARTQKALAWLAAHHRPRLMISAGFSGALQEGVSVGDIVVATEVADEQGSRWTVTWPGDLVSPISSGRLLTVSQIVSTPEEKHRLGRQHGAVAVDMETAPAARFCQQHGIPFGSVRAISDDVHTSLPPRLAALLSGGRVSPLRMLALLIVSPGSTKELCRLARDTRRAAERLANALEQLLAVPAAP